MTFDIDIVAHAGDFALEAQIVSNARVVALVGPSGAGKTTLLSTVAGLLKPDLGHVRIAGATLFDRQAGTVVPPHRRRLGYVFQDGRLFPHLSARGNLRYGVRFAPAEEVHADETAVIERLGLAAFLDRRPATLSGGERRRVAIGRALMTSPRALLLDEPFASLDAARKAELLPYIERLRDDLAIPILLVSHDERDVDRLAEAVVHIDNGRTSPT